MYEIKKREEEEFTDILFQKMKAVNKLESNKIVVLPGERESYLLPFARICYSYHSPFHAKGPQFIAYMLFIAIDFRVSDTSIQCLSVDMIDTELQRYRVKIQEEERKNE